MASIPSVGINNGNVTDPGVVNVEAQAYPRPIDLADTLALNLARLTPGLLFAPPLVPPDNQAGPLPVQVPVADQSFILPSLSLGVPLPNIPSFNVAAQNLVRQPPAEIIVTESGNFQFNANLPQSVTLTILTVSTFTQILNGITTVYFVITFAASVNLMDFGVDLTGSEALFPNSAPSTFPQDFPAGPITKFTNRQIVVDGTDLTVAPVAGNSVIIDVTRHGDDLIFDLFPNDKDVLVAGTPVDAVTTVAADARPVINAFASDGVVFPFIGTGARIPLLLYLDLRETAFFPADQPIKTLGLPLNVNIG